jgi:hypothetical protein
VNILIGCDPEVFVKQNGLFKSAHKLIQGDKKNPFKVRSGAVQVDGMALEFNIDPAATEDQFLFNVQDVFNQMKLMVPEYEVVVTPVAHFDPAYLKAQSPEALELGCDPDFNAWTEDVNPRPDGDRPMRTASGHIHIGFTENVEPEDYFHQHRCNLIAKQLDYYLGLPSLFYDDDVQRREMYGKAGAVRYKSYGVEYRTLSNAWLKTENSIRWVYRNAVKGVTELINGRSLEEKYGDVQDIINTSDKKRALAIIKAEKLELFK